MFRAPALGAFWLLTISIRYAKNSTNLSGFLGFFSPNNPLFIIPCFLQLLEHMPNGPNTTDTEAPCIYLHSGISPVYPYVPKPAKCRWLMGGMRRSGSASGDRIVAYDAGITVDEHKQTAAASPSPTV